MSKLNNKTELKEKKYESEARLAGGYGARAAKQNAEELLKRAVFASLLWENMAYESGNDNSENISNLIPQVSPEKVAEIALEARQKQKLRHVPLFIAREMARYPKYNILLKDLLPKIITRADQLTDFVALYFKDKKQPLTNAVKKGLAKAFYNFKEYHFAKYDRDAAVRLRDVMFLAHPKPRDKDEEALYKKISERSLTAPDTWEVALSSGKDKKETFTRLINEKKLGGLAFLRNLRNMKEAKVDYSTIKKGFDNLSNSVLLPLNFYSAYKHNPEFTREIEDAMLKAYSNLEKLPGHTVFVVDVSGSMGQQISSKSEYSRYEVAASLAMLAAEMGERVTIYATAGSDSQRIHKTRRVPNYRGFSLHKEILSNTLGGGGIFTRQCLEYIKDDLKGEIPDRIIIFSDSQDCDHPDKRIPKPFAKNNYIVDVSAHKHGINYKGVWTAEISGWSENFLNYIAAFEGLENSFNQ